MPNFRYALDLPPGLVSNGTAFSSKGRWIDGDGIRFVDGKPQAIASGVVSLMLSGSANTLTLGYIAGKVIYGMELKLYAGTLGSAPTDITPADLGLANDYWSFANWGSNLLLAAPKSGKLYKSNLASAATVVAAAPVSIGKMLVAPQRQVLAFGCNEESSGTLNGLCIRGSDIEDYTNWTTSATNNAFEDILDDASGIAGAELIGDYVAVWTGTSLFLGQFIGDPGQTWRWDKVDGGTGLAEAEAVVIHNGAAYWLTPDLTFYQWSPGSPPTLLPCPISQDFIDNYGGSPIMFAIPHFNEVWLSYHDSRDGVGPRQIGVCLTDGSWGRSAISAQTFFSSPILADVLVAYDKGAYLSANGAIVYIQGTGPSAATTSGTWSLQSADQYLDDGQRGVMVTGMTADFKEVSLVDLTIFARDRPMSAAVTKGPYEFVSSDTKRNFRASGMLMSFKFSGLGAWRMGTPVFDCITLGER